MNLLEHPRPASVPTPIAVSRERVPGRIYRNFIQFLETSKAKGLAPTFGEICYRNRLGVVLENNLASLGPPITPPSDLNVSFIEVHPSNFEGLHLVYPLKSRYLKAVKNLRSGYGAFAVTRDAEVLGDLWYAGWTNSKGSLRHADLAWLEIDTADKGVYLWDAHVKEEERASSAAIYLLSLSLHSLREKAFSRAYGYVWTDNKPAYFLYRIFNFREIKRIRAERFLFYKRVRILGNSL